MLQLQLGRRILVLQCGLETKALSRDGQCIPAGYCHAHTLPYVSGVNYNVNSKYTKYFAQLCGRISTLLNMATTNQRLLWRHLPTVLQNVQYVAKHIWSYNKQRTQRPNRCTIGDAILPQTGKKLTKKRGSKFRALLWRHLTPQRKTAIQVHNYNPSCIQLLKKRFWKIYFLQHFWCAQTRSFRAVFGLPI